MGKKHMGHQVLISQEIVFHGEEKYGTPSINFTRIVFHGEETYWTPIINFTGNSFSWGKNIWDTKHKFHGE